jgi:hypothetical protein
MAQRPTKTQRYSCLPNAPHAREVWPLLSPVRPDVGADDAAAGAHHPRAKRRHSNVIRPRLGADDGRMWQSSHDTASDRTPLARMLPSVIG